VEFSAHESRSPEQGPSSGDNRIHAPQGEGLVLKAAAKEYKLIAMKTEQDVYLCDRCGAEMLEIHCKLMCPHCGYTRDCSDP